MTSGEMRDASEIAGVLLRQTCDAFRHRHRSKIAYRQEATERCCWNGSRSHCYCLVRLVTWRIYEDVIHVSKISLACETAIAVLIARTSTLM